MADKIKKFFAKKKADAKFKLAGPGHKLNASTSSTNSQIKTPYVPKRTEPSAEARTAAEAALTRLEGKRKDTPFNTSLAAIQAQVKRELEAEQSSKKQDLQEEKSVDLEASPHLAVNGVYFRCPMVSNEVLAKDDWKIKIKEFLYEQLEEERGLTACLIIQSCNSNREKVDFVVLKSVFYKFICLHEFILLLFLMLTIYYLSLWGKVIRFSKQIS